MTTQPTRVGLISDIHGNAVALEAVLEDMGTVDALVCAGDIVGYGPSPGACLDIVRNREIPTVAGNHDRAVVRGQPYESGDEYAQQTLSEAALAWLSELPRERLLFDGSLKVIHDHPTERDRYTMPDAFEPTLLDSEDILVLGHTHIQHAAVFDEGIVVNPGSVGQPRDGNPDAAYALVDVDDLSVTLRRVEYDVDRVQQRIKATNIADWNAQRLTQER